MYCATGRRKRAVALVRIKKGKGNLEVNGRKFENYFPIKFLRESIMEPIFLFDKANKYDVDIKVKGGGVIAQAEAIRLGISRALIKEDEKLRAPLKDKGFLRRDPRKKERKKYGLAGARKRFQFSKR
ncbi:MAG: 30S ribosomal protein S9 [Chlamydiae bacterium SM23_39]|nr:MAG: 30S ribosomal protein S9 [Chlamydiae bacterium SM23_39]